MGEDKRCYGGERFGEAMKASVKKVMWGSLAQPLGTPGRPHEPNKQEIKKVEV